MKPTEIVQTLNELIEISKDGQYSFGFCASHAESAALKLFFQGRAAEFTSAVSELQSLVAEHGGKPVLHGTATGAVHRGWIRVKDTLGGTNDPDLLDDCERGEAQTLKRFRTAANDERLPDGVRATLGRYADATQRCLDQARRLRGELHTAA
jgi:uncharacterized protein (TIGR02284 family)